MANNPQLIKKIIITGKIIAESGIMVGASNSAMEIGGLDKQVIRNPITKIPYIPGSSLKGKMRSLFELNQGTIGKDNRGNFGPTQNPKHAAALLFGHIKDASNERKSQQPSRIIVRDAELTKESQEKLKAHTTLYTETKAENSIDRITSEANPRFFERVPAGAEFALNITLNVFADENEKNEDYLKHVYTALKLVQDDYLGGCGSRGNGQVRFAIDAIVERNKDYYTGNATEKSLSIPPEFKA